MARSKGLLIGCGVLAAIGLVILIFVQVLMGRYNTMVTMDEGVAGSWAQVENVLQRRADLIPNLVETVKGYATHEREIFVEVARARSKLSGAASPREAAAANAGMTSALSRLLAIAENYPQLRANQNFARLQDELAGTENRIAVERRRYNEAVREYNTTIRKFPTSLLSGMFGFDAKEFFRAEEGAREVPQVDFGSKSE